MTKQELIEKLNSAIAEEFEADPASFTPEASIQKTLKIDSLSLVDLVALVENCAGIKIENQDIPHLKTFGALYDYLSERAGK